MKTTIPFWSAPKIANKVTGSNQFSPDYIGLANGNTLVVWHDLNDTVAPGFHFDIVGQILDPGGKPIGGTIFLNETYGADRVELRPEVVALPSGGFTVIYEYQSNQTDLLYRTFDASGTPTGQQGYVVNDAAGGQYYSDFDIAYRPDGSALVTYRRHNGNDEDLLARAINANGSVGAEFVFRNDDDPTNTGYGNGDPDDPRSAVLKDGRVIVAFREGDGGTYGTEFIIIGINNTVVGNANVAPGVRAIDTDVAALEDGGWVISWWDGIQQIGAQIYNDDGTKRGGVIDINGRVSVNQDHRITSLKDGGFAVSWVDNSDNSIKVRTFDENGVKTSKLTSIDAGGDGAFNLETETSPDGRILLSWETSDDGADIVTAVLDPRGSTIKVKDGTTTVAGRDDTNITGSGKDDWFFGMDGNDVLIGRSGADTISGGKGNDAIRGGDNGDQINGGGGKDNIRGDKGKDSINGGGGDDIIYGGRGSDQMHGGGGEDHFVFKSANESKRGSDRDVITDFKPNKDMINLAAIDADTTIGGNQVFEFIGSSGFSDAGQLRAVTRKGSTFVQADRDGDGKADFEIKLAGTTGVDEYDFFL